MFFTAVTYLNFPAVIKEVSTSSTTVAEWSRSKDSSDDGTSYSKDFIYVGF